jgi:hypothetical protein
MGTTTGFPQQPGLALLFILISSNLASSGIMASTPKFKISAEIPSGTMDFFIPIADIRFLVLLILMVNGLPDSFVGICWLLLLSHLPLAVLFPYYIIQCPLFYSDFVRYITHVFCKHLPFTAHRLNFSQRNVCKPKTSVFWNNGIILSTFGSRKISSDTTSSKTLFCSLVLGEILT